MVSETVTFTVAGVVCHYDVAVVRSWPRVVVNGATYLNPMGTKLTVVKTPDHTEYRNGMRESVDRCECCGRADVREAVAYSWDEVLERGWLVPVPDAL